MRCVASSAVAYSGDVPAFELDEATISDLQEAMKSGKLTSRSITEKYLARIDQIDKQGPAINAIIELNPDALSIADAMDRERKEKGPRGPLHGIPILIKDNIDTADKMMTTAGSLALVGSTCAEGFDRCAETARCGRGDSGEDESQRVGEYSFESFDERLERARRADEESVCARSQSVRVEFGFGRGGVGESCGGGDWDGN